MGRAFKILTKDEIIEINHRMIMKFGGVFFKNDNNIGNLGSLDHVLYEIQVEIYGQDPYPDIFDKAAVVGWRIITAHVFHDGNKRTGIETTRLLLELNGYLFQIDSDVINVALSIAKGEINFSDFVEWVRARTVKVIG